MEFFAITGSPASQRTDCAIVGIFEDGTLSKAGSDFDTALDGRLTQLVRQGDLSGKPGQTLLIPDPASLACKRLLLVGLGPRTGYGPKAYRKALATGLKAVTRTGAASAVSHLADEALRDTNPYYAARALAEAACNADYRIPDLKSGKKPPRPALRRVGMSVAQGEERREVSRGLDHGSGIGAGAAFARDLANLPANKCTPSHLANATRALAREHKSITVQILNETEIRRLGMGSFLSVTAGTDEPARLIVARYRGTRGGKRAAPVALVGKGITFDSGGISLKQPQGMDEMKFDMSGAATVLGTRKAAAVLELPLDLVVVVPTCENMPSGRATKPGDIVTSMSGQTIEVLNTDAEGRLILCDALTYVRRFKPATVIDVATLTGACVIALGVHLSGLMTPDDTLAEELLAAGVRAEDRAWRMPIAEEYAEQLKSNFADFANVGGREGGAVTAACFLAKFTDGLSWAHLDIAGTAYAAGSQKSSTGRPVPLLVDYLIHRR
ncbi:MAG TPA: leucyl aminopeptidase [Steroidobacteraceae bacterium]|nr:leucyl aminopeptidase [Steroidobacteraceae bacterium]